MRKHLVSCGSFLARQAEAQSMVQPVVSAWSWDIKFKFILYLTENTDVDQSLRILQGDNLTRGVTLREQNPIFD